MNSKIRLAVIYSGLGALVLILFYALYILQVADVLKSAPITSYCNATDTNSVRSSMVAFDYALKSSHWYNISNFMNATCLRYQSYVLNKTEGEGLLYPKG